jgi:hypothetical protein
MAMISCKDCGQQISDRAVNCPHCGAPTAEAPAPAPRAPRTLYRVLIALVVLGCVASATWLLLPNKSRDQLIGMLRKNWDHASPGSAAARVSPVGKVSPAEDQARPIPIAAPAPVYQTTAEQLAQDYNANGVATQTRLGNRRIRVSGNIAAIDEDASGHPVVKLWTTPNSSADLSLNDDQRTAAAELVKGQAINIECDKMQHRAALLGGSGCALVVVDAGENSAYLAVALSAVEGTAPVYIVGPLPKSLCETRAAHITSLVGLHAKGERVVSKHCAATAQESLPAAGCRLDSSMSTLPDLPAAHLWRYDCAAAPHAAQHRANASTRRSQRRSAPNIAAESELLASDDPGETATVTGSLALPVMDLAVTTPALALPTPGTTAPATSEKAASATSPSRAESTSVAPSDTRGASVPASSTDIAASTAAPATVTPSDLLTVKAADPGAADRIVSYCSRITSAATNRDAVAAGCRREEAAAWNRFVVQNEFPTLDDSSRRKCSEAPFPDSYVAKEACAKYHLHIN